MHLNELSAIAGDLTGILTSVSLFPWGNFFNHYLFSFCHCGVFHQQYTGRFSKLHGDIILIPHFLE
jgi:hypothetical protein